MHACIITCSGFSEVLCVDTGWPPWSPNARVWLYTCVCAALCMHVALQEDQYMPPHACTCSYTVIVQELNQILCGFKIFTHGFQSAKKATVSSRENLSAYGRVTWVVTFSIMIASPGQSATGIYRHSHVKHTCSPPPPPPPTCMYM